MERWDLDLQQLSNVIFDLGLPVYNSDYKIENQGVIYIETPNPNYNPKDFLPKPYFIEKNNLYDFQELLKTPFYAGSHGTTTDRILMNLLFKIDDVKKYEQKYGISKKDLPDNYHKESEFAIYESIVDGDLRPFLEIYSSKDHIENLMNKLWAVSWVKTEEGFSPISKSDELLLSLIAKDGDKFEFEFDETDLKKPGILTNITDNGLNELIDIDIPPPPGLKAEYFLSLIELEFEKIKYRAKKVLETAVKEEQLSLFSNKNIQRLKEIAGQAHTLSKMVKPKSKDTLDDPDYYVIYILKTYIIRSILFYQKLFQPYLKTPIQDEFELGTSLYGQRDPIDVKREFEERWRNELYRNLSLEISTLKNEGNNKNLDQQILLLKNLTLNEIWLNKIAKVAISNGFIGLSHLVFIMASDENYTKNLILTQLIENMFSEIKKRNDFYTGPRKLSISDYKSRKDVWHMLINHWARGNSPIFKDNTYIPLYYIDPTTKDLEKFNIEQKRDQLTHERLKEKSDELSLKEHIEIGKIIHNTARFVKLSELKKSLVDVIGIPLPSALFPDNALFNLEEEIKVKKHRLSQKAKIECRAIAKKIWGKDPKITIADMINHPELLPHTKKKDGNLYTEKTVRNWIKDLCPDRSKGRRKGT